MNDHFDMEKALSDRILRLLWAEAGGKQHGPITETLTIRLHDQWPAFCKAVRAADLIERQQRGHRETLRAIVAEVEAECADTAIHPFIRQGMRRVLAIIKRHMGEGE